MDILKELEKDCESRCQKFLKRYYRLIMKLAKRRLGENFNPTEILSEATIAFHRWSFYHSRSKRTKMPSSFSWFFNKRLDIYDRNGGCSVKDDGEWNHRRYSESDSGDEFSPKDLAENVFDWHSDDGFFADDEAFCLEREERLFHSAINNGGEDIPLSEESDDSGDEISDNEEKVIPEEPYGAKYMICIESFIKIPLLSSDLQKIIRHLSHDKQEANSIAFRRLTKNRSVRSAATIVRGILQWHLAGTPYKLYVGLCLNGTRHHLLVLAETKEEAKKFLKPYGTMLELRPLSADG
jgi:hypothetical protein